MSGDILVIGIGNPMRGDDGIGLAVAEELRPQVSPGVTVRLDSGDVASLLEMWRGASALILVDAVTSGNPPGTIHRFDASVEPLPASVFRCSTHTYGLGEAIELARALGELPPRVIVYGIAGEQFELGAKRSRAVDAAGNELVRRVLIELGPLLKGEHDARIDADEGHHAPDHGGGV